MEKLIIHGGHSLRGTVRVSSAKNAILPIIVATLLPVTPATIVDAPHLDDVSTICSVLESLGVKVTHGEGRITFDAVEVNKTEASYELMSRMRASFLVMGPLLAKMGHARIALPGGCMIGRRPIDLQFSLAAPAMIKDNCLSSFPYGINHIAGNRSIFYLFYFQLHHDSSFNSG